MRRFVFIVAFLAAVGFAVSLGAQEAPDAGTSGGSKATGASGWAAASAPTEVAATNFADLLGRSRGALDGCAGEWNVVWKVAGGEFSLVSGSGDGGSGASAHHAVCDKYRAIANFGGPKVGVTVLGGTIRRVAVLPGGLDNPAAHQSEITRYFDAACSKKTSESSAQAFDTLYEGCSGFDVGVEGGGSGLSLYFFGDYAGFRAEMNALPMPTKSED